MADQRSNLSISGIWIRQGHGWLTHAVLRSNGAEPSGAVNSSYNWLFEKFGGQDVRCSYNIGSCEAERKILVAKSNESRRLLVRKEELAGSVTQKPFTDIGVDRKSVAEIVREMYLGQDTFAIDVNVMNEGAGSYELLGRMSVVILMAMYRAMIGYSSTIPTLLVQPYEHVESKGGSKLFLYHFRYRTRIEALWGF